MAPSSSLHMVRCSTEADVLSAFAPSRQPVPGDAAQARKCAVRRSLGSRPARGQRPNVVDGRTGKKLPPVTNMPVRGHHEWFDGRGCQAARCDQCTRRYVRVHGPAPGRGPAGGKHHARNIGKARSWRGLKLQYVSMETFMNKKSSRANASSFRVFARDGGPCSALTASDDTVLQAAR